MNKITDGIILFIHVVFLIMALIIPFSNSNYFLMMYFITVPFILVHWIYQDNTCMITLVEKYFRKKYNDSNCITCQIIEPIYDFPQTYKKYNTLIYGTVCVLMLIVISKLSYKYYSGGITKIKDLFVI